MKQHKFQSLLAGNIMLVSESQTITAGLETFMQNVMVVGGKMNERF